MSDAPDDEEAPNKNDAPDGDGAPRFEREPGGDNKPGNDDTEEIPADPSTVDIPTVDIPAVDTTVVDPSSIDGAPDDPSRASDEMAEQGGITFGGELIKKAFGFLVVALITRLVSPGIYGLFVLATSVLHLLQVFASAGLHRAIDYFVPQYIARGEPGKARGVTLQVFGLLLVTSLTTGSLLYLGADRLAAAFDEPALATALRMLAVALPLLAMFNGLLAAYSGIKVLKYRVYVRDVTRPTVRLLTTAALLIAGYGLLGVVGGFVVGLAISIVLGSVLLVRHDALRGAKAAMTPFREILWYGVPLAFAGVIYVVMGQVDYFVVGYFLSSSDVGIYRVGYMLAANLLVFFSSLAPIFKPLIAEERRDGDAVEKRYRTATRWVLGLSLPFAAILVLGAEVYLSIVFTPQYAVASGVVLALVVGYLISITAGGPDGALLQGLGYSRLVFVNSGILLVANVVFSVLLVPRYGILGAGLGTMLALTLSGTAALAEVYYYRGIHPFSPALGRVLTAWLPALGAGWLVVRFVPDRFLVAIVLPLVVLVVYAVAMRAFGAITPEDLRVAETVAPASVAARLRRAVDVDPEEG